MKGYIRTLSDRNFGFIKATNGTDYFFHRDDFSGFWDDLVADYQAGKVTKEFIQVTFEPGEGLKGPRASNISRLDFPNQ